MGQEIGKTEFTDADFAEFGRRLRRETALLRRLVREGRCSARGPCAGFELEAWLVDASMNPVPRNAEFLDALDSPMAFPELARFNVEFNNMPRPLTGGVLSDLHADLDRQWASARRTAADLGLDLLTIGILPTLREADLHLGNLSATNRYRALNEQLLAQRCREPLRLRIAGRERLALLHEDVMLEAATTSFQLHWQVPAAVAAAHYNAALLASGPVLGVACNSPILFGRELWAETRIPVFEQAVATADPQGLGRVNFGSGYLGASLAELFLENLRRFPVLLPILTDGSPEAFAHLRLHNGTIWPWNRAIVGFDPDGTPHLRIEHRVLPAGPSLADMIANAAFFYGLTASLVREDWAAAMPFAVARDNFYRAARAGLDADLIDSRGRVRELRRWILEELLPQARSGLTALGMIEADRDHYLDIIERRAATGRTGADWQRRYLKRHPRDFAGLTRTYATLQNTGEPVHRWPL